MKYQKLFSPITVGGVTLKNRFAMAPMGPLGLADANGGWNQRGIDYYTARAKGGTGLIITGVTFFDQFVEKQDPSTVPNPLYKPVQFVKTSREMTERVHAYGSKIFLQLSAGFGRVTIPTNVGDIPPIAPSPVQAAPPAPAQFLPFSAEAFQQARTRDVPVLLFISDAPPTLSDAALSMQPIR